MAGLTDRAGGVVEPGEASLETARSAWEESMSRRINDLRAKLEARSPDRVAVSCGASRFKAGLRLHYWQELVLIEWPDLAPISEDGETLSTFDTAMLLYYLSTADGTPLADRWIGFRELPGGAFYNQAFQGYSGNRLAQQFGTKPAHFDTAAKCLDSVKLSGLASHAYAFQPLPRIRLAAVLWPGDDEFPAKASVLFDAASSHYMTTDGLALLGSGLTRRLEGAGRKDHSG